MITIKVPMSVNGIKELQKKITKIKKLSPKMQQRFITKSLRYIKKKANEHLKENYSAYSWYERTGRLEHDWEIVATEFSGTLRNLAPYSAFVEYGTGLVGKHPMADVHNYQYNVNDHQYGWLFYFENESHFTQGLEGYWFVYQAVYNDYLMTGMARKLFNEAFEEVIGRAIK